jgi:ATP-dependent Clp endopeptidase proteolytic subunit ClpP
MRSWFNIKAAAAGADTAEISIFDEIGAWGISAKDFITDLKAKAAGATKATLLINSNGGDVFQGWAIFNALKSSGLDITVKVMGIAASMASVVAMAGKRIEMPANSMMMVHNASSGLFGDAENMRAVADVLDKIDNSIVAAYAARTGKSEDEVRALMSADSYLTAAECVELGFADEVTGAAKVTALFDIERLPENVRALFESPPVDDPSPLVDEIVAQASAAGLSEFAATWALDAAITDVEAVRSAVASARAIKALCTLVGKGDLLTAFVNSKATVVEARSKLSELLVAESNATAIDKVPCPGTKSSAPKAAVTSAAVWAAGSMKQKG